MAKAGYVHVNVVLPTDLWKRIRASALDQDLSASALIERVMEEHLEKKKPRGK